MHQLNSANEWYRSNGMLVQTPVHDNRKHESCVFLSGTQITVAVFGITVDDRLYFDEHISNISFHTPKLKSNSMILWKDFLVLKEKASLLQIIFAPSGRMIRRQRGTRTSPAVCFVSLLTFLSTNLRSFWKLCFPASYWYTNVPQQCTSVG